MHPDTINFLKALSENNTRNFFGIIKPLYDQVREQLIAFTDDLIQEIKKFDDKIDEDLTAKKCLFRIYRDARRLKEGDPVYKKNFGFAISPSGKNDSRAGYYLHIQPWASFFGGGIYRPEPEELLNLRHYLLKYGDEYTKLTKNKEFVKEFGKVGGDELKRFPKWFFADSPHLDLIKKKQHLISHYYTDKEISHPDFKKLFLSHCKIAMPWFHFLNKAYHYTERQHTL
jgi:uncharacterized protein (TIGR02453 family)